MQKKYSSPVKGNTSYGVQIGPTPQLKGHVKSILDVNTPTPKKSTFTTITKQLTFEESPAKEVTSFLKTKSTEMLPFSPIKLLKNLSVNKVLISDTNESNTSLNKDILQDNSSDGSDHDDESGLLFLKKKISIKPNAKLLQDFDEEVKNDPLAAVPQEADEINEIAEPDYSNEKVIGRPVQGYLKRKLLEMHPNIQLQEHIDMQEGFNEKFTNLEKANKQKEEGTYYADNRYKGTLTDDVLPDIISKKRRKYNVVSENYVKINLKRKKFKKSRK